jgi:glucose-6-phosphate-specific signal transduction histidine kinase
VTLRVGELTHFDLLAESKSGQVKTLGGVTLDLVAQDGLSTQLKHGQGGPQLRVSALGGDVTVRPYDGTRLGLMLKN